MYYTSGIIRQVLALQPRVRRCTCIKLANLCPMSVKFHFLRLSTSHRKLLGHSETDFRVPGCTSQKLHMSYICHQNCDKPSTMWRSKSANLVHNRLATVTSYFLGCFVSLRLTSSKKKLLREKNK